MESLNYSNMNNFKCFSSEFFCRLYQFKALNSINKYSNYILYFFSIRNRDLSSITIENMAIKSEIERESNRLLKSASSFDKSTKSSIKVYHLQEIGKLADHRNQLLLDERLQTLVSQINLDLHILSPSQLVAVALGYRNIGLNRKSYWSKLCYEVYRHAKSHTSGITGITRSQVSMILGCYARLFTDPLKQTKDLLKWITFDVGNLNEYDYAYITFYMYRTKMANNTEDDFNIKCLKAVTMGYLEKIHLFSPQSLVCILNNYSKMPLLPWHIIFKTNNLLKLNISKLKFKALAIHLRSLMNVKLRDLGILQKISKRLSKDRRVAWAGPFEVSTIIYSLGRLGYRNRLLLNTLIDISQRAIFVMNDGDLMRVIHGFANLGVATRTLWESIAKILEKRIDVQPPQHLSIVASGFAKVGILPSELFDSVKHKFSQLSNGFTSRQIISLLDSCVILGYYDSILINQLLNCYLELNDQIPDFINPQLIRIGYSILLEAPETLKNATNAMQTFIVNHSQIYDNTTSNEKFLTREAAFNEKREKAINVAINEEKEFNEKKEFNENKSKLTRKNDITFDLELNELIRQFQADGELDESLEVNARVGIYTLHLREKQNIIDFLSKGQTCPVTEVMLGPALLKCRQMELLGYSYRTINRSKWNSLSKKDKIATVTSLLLINRDN